MKCIHDISLSLRCSKCGSERTCSDKTLDEIENNYVGQAISISAEEFNALSDFDLDLFLMRHIMN